VLLVCCWLNCCWGLIVAKISKDLVLDYKVLNWETYNPINDGKKHTWMRLDPAILDNAEVEALPPAGFKLCIYLLLKALRKRGKATQTLLRVTRECSIRSRDQLESYLQALQRGGIIEYEISGLTQKNSLRYVRNDTYDTNDTLTPSLTLPTEESSTNDEGASEKKNSEIDSSTAEPQRDIETTQPDETTPADPVYVPADESQPVSESEPAAPFDDEKPDPRFPADCSANELEVLKYAAENLERVLGPQEIENFLEKWRAHPTYAKANLITTIDWIAGHPKALEGTHSIGRLFYPNAIKKDVQEWEVKVLQALRRDIADKVPKDEIVLRFCRGNPTMSKKAIFVYVDRIFSRLSSA
jgi:hypothetical protein